MRLDPVRGQQRGRAAQGMSLGVEDTQTGQIRWVPYPTEATTDRERFQDRSGQKGSNSGQGEKWGNLREKRGDRLDLVQYGSC